jgi:hypothetical protein
VSSLFGWLVGWRMCVCFAGHFSEFSGRFVRAEVGMRGENG